MPTGYTAQIIEGITLKQFIMSCARAFGACVDMREDPADAPIPESFNASTYHLECREEAEKKLAEISNMSIEEAAKASNDDYNKEQTRVRKAIKDNAEQYMKYSNMLKQVRAWTPPSSEHVGLKDFMIDQIEGSIKFDNMSEYYENRLVEMKRLSGLQWKKQRIDSIVHDIKYHAGEYAEEKARVESRNSWIKALRKSLEGIK